MPLGLQSVGLTASVMGDLSHKLLAGREGVLRKCHCLMDDVEVFFSQVSTLGSWGNEDAGLAGPFGPPWFGGSDEKLLPPHRVISGHSPVWPEGLFFTEHSEQRGSHAGKGLFCPECFLRRRLNLGMEIGGGGAV